MDLAAQPPAPARPDTPPSSPAEAGALAQGVQCGPWPLAFPFSWARSIVEDYELSEVPHAPSWLLGAANVDGRVVPVIELALYLDPAWRPEPAATPMLLVGGEGEDAAGIVFRGLPAIARAQPEAPAPALPAALAEFFTGTAGDGGDRHWAMVDAPALLDALSAELALA